MKLSCKSLCALFYFLSFFTSMLWLEGAETKRQERMQDEVESLRRTFSLLYAPATYKKEKFGWDIEIEAKNLKTEIEQSSTMTIAEFHNKILRMVKGSNDFHVNIGFHSSAASMLPVCLKFIQNRVYLVEFEDEVVYGSDEEEDLDDTVLEIFELLAVDGVDVETYFAHFIKEEMGLNPSMRTYNMAALNFSLRIGYFGMRVPNDGEQIVLTVKKPDGEIVELTKSWCTVAEEKFLPRKITQSSENNRWSPILEQSQFLLPEIGPIQTAYCGLIKKYPKFEKFGQKFVQFRAPYSRHIFKAPSFEEEVDFNSDSIFDEPFGKVLWQTNWNWLFNAYIFQTAAGKNIGYIYIPTYKVDDSVTHVQHFAQLMQFFNENTEALIIDQLDNPGGSLFYLYALASCLTDRPLRNMCQVEMLTYEHVYGMESFVEELGELVTYGEEVGLSLEELLANEEDNTLTGYPIDNRLYRSLEQYVKFLKQEWLLNKDKIDPFPVMGIEQILPHNSSRYTKPILMLINENNASCGDIMPALLQDNKRAKLFGKTTAGAGGYIKMIPHQTWFGVGFLTLTGSLLYRVDGNVIENVGVTPDVFYEVTLDDVKNGFFDYQRAVLVEVEKLLEE